eukprot:765148-Hanusia_phi.AAC.1
MVVPCAAVVALVVSRLLKIAPSSCLILGVHPGERELERGHDDHGSKAGSESCTYTSYQPVGASREQEVGRVPLVHGVAEGTKRRRVCRLLVATIELQRPPVSAPDPLRSWGKRHVLARDSSGSQHSVAADDAAGEEDAAVTDVCSILDPDRLGSTGMAGEERGSAAEDNVIADMQQVVLNEALESAPRPVDPLPHLGAEESEGEGHGGVVRADKLSEGLEFLARKELAHEPMAEYAALGPVLLVSLLLERSDDGPLDEEDEEEAEDGDDSSADDPDGNVVAYPSWRQKPDDGLVVVVHVRLVPRVTHHGDKDAENGHGAGQSDHKLDQLPSYPPEHAWPSGPCSAVLGILASYPVALYVVGGGRGGEAAAVWNWEAGDERNSYWDGDSAAEGERAQDHGALVETEAAEVSLVDAGV